MKDKEKSTRTKRTRAKKQDEQNEEIKEFPPQTTFNRDDMRIIYDEQEGENENVHTTDDEAGSRE